MTDVVFILDRSGSMGGLESDTIGGYNSLLEKQRKSEEKIKVTTVLFDDRYELLHNREDIENVKPMTKEDYYVRGCTALYDAVGKTVNLLKNTSSDKVLMVITTDGLENASREFKGNDIRRMISQQKEKGWEFLFLGANIDSAETAERMGIDRSRAADYVADSEGVAVNFECLQAAVGSFVRYGCVKEDWSEEIRENYRKER